jgi:hypothetical protein
MFRDWSARLPAQVQRGTIPSQREADGWVRQATTGQVERFPAELGHLTELVLASALATDVSWVEGYVTTADPGVLGGEFGPAADRCLVSRRHVYLVDTEAAGLVATHTAWTPTGLRVVNVIAAPEVSQPAVHRAALEILGHRDGSHPRTLRLRDVALGEGHAWTLQDSSTEEDTSLVVLPAWEASSDADVATAPGAPVAMSLLEPMLTGAAPPQIRQAVRASYDESGFRAAAVTGLAFIGGAPTRRSPARELTVRFNRPYAVVAATAAVAPDIRDARLRSTQVVADDVWDGVPVFSAWVTSPVLSG